MTVQDIVSLITAALAVIPSLIGIVIFTINLIKNRNWDVLKDGKYSYCNARRILREHPEMVSEQNWKWLLKLFQYANVAGVI